MPNDAAQTGSASAHVESRYAAQRARLGIDSYHSAIEAASKYPADRMYGIPLIPSESSKLDRRVAAVPVVESIRDLLESLGLFGGIWIDDSDPIGISVALAGTPSAAQVSELKDMAGGYALSFVQRDIPYSALRDIQAKIRASEG